MVQYRLPSHPTLALIYTSALAALFAACGTADIKRSLGKRAEGTSGAALVGTTNLLSNAGFESGNLTGWNVWESVSGATFTENKGPASGQFHAAQWSAGAAQSYLSQTISVANGTYQASCFLYGKATKAYGIEVKDFGGATTYQTVNSATAYTQVTLSNINVTAGKLTLGIWYDSAAGGWSRVDDCAVVSTGGGSGGGTTPPPPPPPTTGLRKKGLGMWGTAGSQGSQVNATWYYNWNAAPTMGSSGSLEFVPMIWQTSGSRGPTAANIAAAKAAASPYLLGFNEPDNGGLGGTGSSVDSAIAAWPALMSTGKRLGSPAVAGNYNWLADFMNKAKAKGYRVDFIAMHLYPNWSAGANGVQKFKDLATSLHNTYKLPIWVTEFGTCDYSGGSGSNAQVQKFTTEAVNMLEGLAFVERYAWFSDKGYSGCNQSAIWNNSNVLSPAGTAYRDAGNNK